MVTRIIYDTEFIDDGSTITPLSIAMRRSDGAELYAINEDLAVMARAAENGWLRENVLKWLPLSIKMSAGYGVIDARVQWNDEHEDYDAIKSLDEIAGMVEDFVLERPDPQLWAYYASYDHVLYAQLFGPMIDLPERMPKYTMDIKHEAVVRLHRDEQLPELPQHVVDSHFNGVRKEHHAMYDVYEEEYRLNWLLTQLRQSAV
jgi:hypothetical protein